MRPFFDQDNQLFPGSTFSDLFSTLTTFGVSLLGCFAMLQTLRSPSSICVASMSDFCFEDDPCHANVTTGDGGRVVVRVCSIVKVGCRVTIRIDPLLYLNPTSVFMPPSPCDWRRTLRHVCGNRPPGR